MKQSYAAYSSNNSDDATHSLDNNGLSFSTTETRESITYNNLAPSTSTPPLHQF